MLLPLAGGSGTVIAAVGPDVTTPKPGDRVVCGPVIGAEPSGAPRLLGVNAWGGYAEYVNVAASITHLIPDGLDFVTAAVIARHGPLALRSCATAPKPRPASGCSSWARASCLFQRQTLVGYLRSLSGASSGRSPGRMPTWQRHVGEDDASAPAPYCNKAGDRLAGDERMRQSCITLGSVPCHR
jgi:hypothetical protein